MLPLTSYVVELKTDERTRVAVLLSGSWSWRSSGERCSNWRVMQPETGEELMLF